MNSKLDFYFAYLYRSVVLSDKCSQWWIDWNFIPFRFGVTRSYLTFSAVYGSL